MNDSSDLVPISAGLPPRDCGDPGDGTDLKSLWAALEEVTDPEFPVSVVELGLIYGIRRKGGGVQVTMTLTSTGCPCMDFITEDIRNRLLAEPGVETVAIELVWDPPWTRDRISNRAIEKLKKWGVSA